MVKGMLNFIPLTFALRTPIYVALCNKYRQQFISVCAATLKMRYVSAHNLSF